MARYDPEGVADLLERLRARTGAGGSVLARECRLFLDWDQVAGCRRRASGSGITRTRTRCLEARVRKHAEKKSTVRGRR